MQDAQKDVPLLISCSALSLTLSLTVYLAGRTMLETHLATAISTTATLAAFSSQRASATANQRSLAQFSLPPAAVAWEFGTCPLIIYDADFFGTESVHYFQPQIRPHECHHMTVHLKILPPGENECMHRGLCKL